MNPNQDQTLTRMRALVEMVDQLSTTIEWQAQEILELEAALKAERKALKAAKAVIDRPGFSARMMRRVKGKLRRVFGRHGDGEAR